MARRAALIGHFFHNHTKSSAFFLEMLEEHYDLDFYDHDPDNPDTLDYATLLERDYDVYFFWHTEMVAAQLAHSAKGQFVIIPMYDGAVQRRADYWSVFPRALFISFSAELHMILQAARCNSIYVQYFPDVTNRIWDTSKPATGFFWERVPGNQNDGRSVIPQAAALGLEELHIHVAADTNSDPKARRAALDRIAKQQDPPLHLNFSEWFENPQDMHDVARKHAVYFAPRMTEGIGMSFLEAMAAGQVVIGADEPTLNEYVVDGETGLLLDKDYSQSDVEPLDPAALLKMSHNAQSRVLAGREEWELDKDRLMAAILRGYPQCDEDSGSGFEQSLRISAGRRP